MPTASHPSSATSFSPFTPNPPPAFSMLTLTIWYSHLARVCAENERGFLCATKNPVRNIRTARSIHSSLNFTSGIPAFRNSRPTGGAPGYWLFRTMPRDRLGVYYSQPIPKLPFEIQYSVQGAEGDHPNFNNPLTSFGNGSFGNITGTSYENRDIQFGLKLAF